MPALSRRLCLCGRSHGALAGLTPRGGDRPGSVSGGDRRRGVEQVALTAADLLTGATIAGAATFVERVLQPDVQALVY